MKRKIKKIIYIVLAVLVVAFVAFKLLAGSKRTPVIAETIKVKKGDVTTTVTATGTIEPITQVEVGTQVSGVVEKLYVDYNSIVKQGQLIAELDKTNLQAALVQAQASYDNAINERDYQSSIYKRQKALYDEKLISQADYDLALYNLNNAKSSVIQKKSDLDKAKTNLSYAQIYSPISGVVLSKDVDEGQTVAASYSTPTLFTIARDLREMQVEADVDEADIGQVEVGQRVSFTVDAYQGEEFAGKVTQIRLNPTTTSNVVTYTVVIKADNVDLKLKPGMTATITIYTQELKNVLTLEAKGAHFKPDETLFQEYAVQHQQNVPESKTAKIGYAIVYVMKNGKIEPVEVKTGSSDGINVQVLSGLSIGDSVVYEFKEMTEAEAGGSASSPFMPTPPGKKKSK